MHSKLYKIWKKVEQLKYINPVNINSEKRKFLRSDRYNPQFKYLRIDFPIDRHIKELNRIRNSKNDDNIIINKMIQDKAEELYDWLILLKNRGKPQFTYYSKKEYGVPSKELVKKALQILKKTKVKEETGMINSEQLVKLLRKEIKRIGINWKIKLRENLGSRADDVAPEKTLYIRKGEMFTKKDVKKLIVHELKTHSVRAVNGEKQKEEIFSIGTKGFLETEEGLAIYMEKINGCLSPHALKDIAGRAVAIDMSLRKPFREVFEYLVKYFPAEEAFKLVMRVKRGLKDTSKPGAFTKDYLYLNGFYKVAKLSKKDIELLFIGRISMDDLSKVKKLIKAGIVIQ